MKILYCHDNIYKQAPDGTIYSAGQFPYSYWGPFIETFGHITVLGRGRPVGNGDNIDKMNVSNGPHVTFNLFPNINSLPGRLKYYRNVSRRIASLVEQADGIIVRAVSDIGWLAFCHARRLKKPVAMEMAACAWDSTWNHGHSLGKIYAPMRYCRDKKIAGQADFVIYVSQDFLPRRYPANGEVAFASNVRLSKVEEDALDKRMARIKKVQDNTLPHKIGLIGHLGNKLKNVKGALKALAIVESEKPGCFQFHHLGPGDPAPYRQQAYELGLRDVVHFDGMLPSGEAVLHWLDEIDLYIQPSFQEGVPRAVIEAMSRGCPVIGSTAGGIPELVDKNWLHRPADIRSLSDLIMMMLDSPEKQIEAAGANIIHAHNFTSDILMPRRQAFWSNFRSYVEKKAA